MYELLIRIETLCLEAKPLTLAGVGAVSTIVGLLLWLAGTYFSSIIIGVLGAVTGSFCGLLISQWLDIHSLLSMAIGAAVLCAAAVFFRNVIIIVLAIIIFALASGTTYSSIILGNPAQQPDTQEGPALVQSFSRMDPTMRLSHFNRITEAQEGFFEKLKTLLRDTLNTMDPHKWKLLLSILLGGIAGFLLIRIVKRLVLALCCSGLGALLVLMGVETLLMTVGAQMCGAFQENRFALTVVYFSMVGVGTVVQLILAKSRRPKEVKARKR